jgi:hypothetical protein
MSILSIRHHV